MLSRHGKLFTASRKSVTKMFLRSSSILLLGLTCRQWVVCMLISTLITLSLAAPAGAFDVKAAPTSIAGIEPVNESLPLWTDLWRSANARVEATLTPLRAANRVRIEEDDKRKNTGVSDKYISSEDKEKTDHRIATDRDVDDTEVGASDDITSSPEEDEHALNEESRVQPVEPVPAVPPTVVSTPVLPPGEVESMFEYQNNLGSPPGQVQMDSRNPAATALIEHRPGNSNFIFNVPFAS